MIDTGASVSIMREDEWRRSLISELLPAIEDASAANNSPLCIIGSARVTLRLGERDYQQEVLIAPVLSHPLLLGADFLRRYQCDILLSSGVLKIGRSHSVRLEEPEKKAQSSGAGCVVVAQTLVLAPESEVVFQGEVRGRVVRGDYIMEPRKELGRRGLRAAASVVRANITGVPVRLINSCPNSVTLHRDTKIGDLVSLTETYTPNTTNTVSSISTSESSLAPPTFDLSETCLSSTAKLRLEHLLNHEYRDVFSLGPWDLGCTNLVQHTIDTGDAAPIRQPPRRQAEHHREAAITCTKELLENNIITESNSPWCSPIVMVNKKDGSLRMCLDLRKVNGVTKKDSYPLPMIADILDSMAGAQYFTVFDLASGYYQVEIAPEDREKTAFAAGGRLYEFRVVPFGLCNAPATFQRLMNRVLYGLQWETCMVYVDDVVVWGRSEEEHHERLREVLERLNNAKLKVKPSKCQIGKTSVSFLGHVVSREGVAPDEKRVQQVREWPPPSDITELKSFLGTASYYRRFIKNYAAIATPLHRLEQKGEAFNWSEECDAAFRFIKNRLTTAPILAYPTRGAKFVLDTDASNYAVGAVLNQIQDGHERVVAYASRTLTRPERRYCATRRELLGLIFGTREFRPYLLGREFVARTDHNSLQWLQNLKDAEGQVARWLEQLA